MVEMRGGVPRLIWVLNGDLQKNHDRVSLAEDDRCDKLIYDIRLVPRRSGVHEKHKVYEYLPPAGAERLEADLWLTETW